MQVMTLTHCVRWRAPPHIRCDNLEKLLVLFLKDVGLVKLSRLELAAEMVGGFELNTEDDHCVASWVPTAPTKHSHRTDLTGPEAFLLRPAC